MNAPKETSPSCIGYCSRCETYHQLPLGNSYQYGLKLIHRLENATSIDFETNREKKEPCFDTDYLYGEAMGKMFGVLECRDIDGTTKFLHGFSGQYNGRWRVNGWVESLFDVDEWHRTNVDVEKEIKCLTRQIDSGHDRTEHISHLKRLRKKLSQQLMKDIHSLYKLTNFRGETKTFAQLFPHTKNIPTGTGDCCAPKLLCHAAENNLLPISMAEFYVGRKNRSGSKLHGHFYPSCEEKCQPLMGFLLCGLDTTL